MALVGIQGITLSNGEGAKVDLSIIEAKTLRILRTKDVGTLMTATAQNPGQIAGGTAVFRNTQLIQVKTYDGTDQADTPAVVSKVIHLDQRKTAARELETFDLAGLETSAEIEAIIADGMALSIMAHKDAVLLAAMYKVIADAATGGDSTVFTVAPTMDSTTDKDASRLNRLLISDKVSDLTGVIDMEMVGTDKEEVIVWTNNRVKQRLIDSLTASHVGTSKEIDGMLNMVAGIALAEHKFIGKNIAAGSSFDKDTAFDFSNIQAMVVHTEAMAMPFNFNSITYVVNQNNANPRFIAKFQYGVGAVRPNLMHCFVKADPTT